MRTHNIKHCVSGKSSPARGPRLWPSQMPPICTWPQLGMITVLHATRAQFTVATTSAPVHLHSDTPVRWSAEPHQHPGTVSVSKYWGTDAAELFSGCDSTSWSLLPDHILGLDGRVRTHRECLSNGKSEFGRRLFIPRPDIIPRCRSLCSEAKSPLHGAL